MLIYVTAMSTPGVGESIDHAHGRAGRERAVRQELMIISDSGFRGLLLR